MTLNRSNNRIITSITIVDSQHVRAFSLDLCCVSCCLELYWFPPRTQHVDTHTKSTNRHYTTLEP